MHYICYLDAQAIKDRIELARYFHLKGVYFFKIDGLEDPAMWSTLGSKTR
jgi:spore germination protein YaaH